MRVHFRAGRKKQGFTVDHFRITPRRAACARLRAVETRADTEGKHAARGPFTTRDPGISIVRRAESLLLSGCTTMLRSREAAGPGEIRLVVTGGSRGVHLISAPMYPFLYCAIKIAFDFSPWGETRSRCKRDFEEGLFRRRVGGIASRAREIPRNCFWIHFELRKLPSRSRSLYLSPSRVRARVHDIHRR